MKLALILMALLSMCVKDANKARDAELRKAVEALCTAANARDVDAILDCYHPDIPDRGDTRKIYEGLMKFDLVTNQRIKKFKVEHVKGNRVIVTFTVRMLKVSGRDFFYANDIDWRVLLKKHEGKWFWWGVELLDVRVLASPDWVTPTITVEDVEQMFAGFLRQTDEKKEKE